MVDTGLAGSVSEGVVEWMEPGRLAPQEIEIVLPIVEELMLVPREWKSGLPIRLRMCLNFGKRLWMR